MSDPKLMLDTVNHNNWVTERGKQGKCQLITLN
jgi:hypothetical protein